MSLLLGPALGLAVKNRGMDHREIVKDARNAVRRGLEIGKTDLRRVNELYEPKAKKQVSLRRAKPVVSTRGGDVRNIVQDARKRSQFKKAHSDFTKLAHAPVRIY